MSFLVIGGAGYVGSHMVKRLLSKGHSVTVLDNLSRGHRDATLSAEFFEGDLLDQSRLREVFKDRKFDADGTCVRDCVHVDDLATAHLAAANE